MQKSFVDQMGRSITINFPPKRIVSIVPSQTELLFDLGLDQEVVGITKFCIHPVAQFASRPKVGGTKKLLIDKIRALSPDLIIGNKEENTKEEIEILSQEFPIWMSDITTLTESMDAISRIGELVDRQPEAAYLNHLIHAGFSDLQTLALERNIKKTVAYVIWKDPYLFAGRETFIDDVMQKIGLQNMVKEKRYPELSITDLQGQHPDLIFLSSEPYPFKEKHIQEIQQALPNSRVMLVDGEMFSWYGSRLVKAVQYFFEFQQQLL